MNTKQTILILVAAAVLLVILFAYGRPSTQTESPDSQKGISESSEGVVESDLDWKEGDKFGDFTLVGLKIEPVPGPGNDQIGAEFTGTTTISGTWSTSDMFGKEFTVSNADADKIPQFPFNKGYSSTFCFKNTADEIERLLPGQSGEAKIRIATFSLGYYPKDTCQVYTRVIEVL